MQPFKNLEINKQSIDFLKNLLVNQSTRHFDSISRNKFWQEISRINKNLVGANLSEIKDFSIKNNIQIPQELQNWLLYCNGLILSSGVIYGINSSEDWLNIEQFYEIFPSWKEKKWIPIAGDGCGNYYVIFEQRLNEESNYPIYFVDTHDDPDCLTYVVASNLYQFIRFMLETAMGEDYWPFEKEKVLSKDPILKKCKNAPLPWET